MTRVAYLLHRPAAFLSARGLVSSQQDMHWAAASSHELAAEAEVMFEHFPNPLGTITYNPRVGHG